MNHTDLFEMLGGIDSSLIARCENDKPNAPKQTRLRWGAAAACLCVMALCSIALPFIHHTYKNPVVASNPQGTADTSIAGAEHLVNINELEKAPHFTTHLFYLNPADFVSMTDDELVDYYGITFNIEIADFALTLQQQNPNAANGLYKNSEGGVYYDTNIFVYQSAGGFQRLAVTLGKAFHAPGFIAQSSKYEHSLKQSEINGVGVTIFHYRKDGSDCYHTEFLNNGVSYRITSYNLPLKDYIEALASIIADNYVFSGGPASARAAHTAAGFVDTVDTAANFITIKPENAFDPALAVYLPDGEASRYSLGDKIEIRYIGNPMTIGTIWPQQLSRITVSNG